MIQDDNHFEVITKRKVYKRKEIKIFIIFKMASLKNIYDAFKEGRKLSEIEQTIFEKGPWRLHDESTNLSRLRIARENSQTRAKEYSLSEYLTFLMGRASPYMGYA